MVRIGLGGNVLTAEITLVDGSEIAVVTGADAARGVLPALVNVEAAAVVEVLWCTPPSGGGIFHI